MTDKARKIYDEADKMFDEYGSGSLECDMLDFLWDLLEVLPDEFLDLFDIAYNTDTEECDDEEIIEAFGIDKTYEYPQTIFRMKQGHTCKQPCSECEVDHSPTFVIDCCGYESCDHDYSQCTPNHDNSSEAKEFWKHLCEIF